MTAYIFWIALIILSLIFSCNFSNQLEYFQKIPAGVLTGVAYLYINVVVQLLSRV